MIKKIYRLKENEIKKVLKYKKPFFSYWFIANYLDNRMPISRFWIILWSKNCPSWVWRNFWRRKFYDLVSKHCEKGWKDIVFVPKKWKAFDKNSAESIVEFEKDVNFIIKKIYN